MQELPKNNQHGTGSKDHNYYVDDKTQEKIDKHLTDVNDKISEEDIQNINTDIKTNAVANTSEERDKILDDNDEDDSHQQNPTVFNILGY